MATVTQIPEPSRGLRAADLAHEIALEETASLFDCHLCAIRDKRGRLLWYDVATADEYCAWSVQRAMKYLELRGLLRRHPRVTNYVNWRRS